MIKGFGGEKSRLFGYDSINLSKNHLGSNVHIFIIERQYFSYQLGYG